MLEELPRADRRHRDRAEPGDRLRQGDASSPREAYRTDKGILQIVREKGVLTEAQIQELLDPEKLTGLDPSIYQGKSAPKGR